MTYLDYSATTMVSDEALDVIGDDLFKEASLDELNLYSDKICSILGVDMDVIFTSGSSESNNYVLKGTCCSSKNEIITSYLEHSSINETLSYLEKNGYVIKYVSIKDGSLDLEELENLITDKTCLITISSVNSETGMIQDIDSIGKLAHKNNVLFHSDMTQSIGKVFVPFENVDFVSISSHKFYGPKGIGLLLKNKNVNLKPLIYGTRKYNLGLIKGMVKALELAMSNLSSNYKKVEDLRAYLKDNIVSLPNISINEGKENIPHILNISVKNYKPETFLHYMEMNDIYISTKSACSSGDYSMAVYKLTGDLERASTSVRFSLSYLNNKEELDKVIELIKRSEHGR